MNKLKLAAIIAASAALAACNSEDNETTREVPTAVDTASIECLEAGDALVDINEDEDGNALPNAQGVLKRLCYLRPGIFVSGTVDFDSDNVYAMTGGSITIGNDEVASDDEDQKDTVLNIEAGTTIYGNSSTPIIVARDGQIFATGTATAPITFTTIDEATATDEDPFDTSGHGLWGGLVINGRAPVHDGELEGEGFSGLYGGTLPEDNSGTLQYVVVKYAGYAFTPTNELNGIAFQGVGSGTTVEYIQIHNNADDGVEFFGGTVNVKYLVLTGNLDDSIDWTKGWTGKLQYAYVDMIDGSADKGIEADNSSSSPDKEPRSNPTLANVTILTRGNTGANFRRGTHVTMYNSVMDGKLDLDQAETDPTLISVAVSGLKHDKVGDTDETDAADQAADIAKVDATKNTVDRDGFTIDEAMHQVTADVNAVNVAEASEDDFFDAAQFLGAAEANSANPWYKADWVYTDAAE